MNLLALLRDSHPRVELRVVKHMSTDLRRPWEVAIREFKRRRARECRKVPVGKATQLTPFLKRQAGHLV